MKRRSLADACRIAAQAEAYDWYCRAMDIPDPEMDTDLAVLDGLIEQHGAAWAWAKKNWRAFLPHTNSPESQFLIDLLRKREGHAGEVVPDAPSIFVPEPRRA
jgi:ferric-dicitrate binding protein FerR (iron transport regulator)